MKVLEEFDEIASEAWRESKTPLERLYDTLLGEDAWREGRPPTRYRIYGHDSRPIPCHLCQSTDRWVIEGDEVRRVARAFVCEHEPIHVGRGAIRQISSVPPREVAWCEETFSFEG